MVKKKPKLYRFHACSMYKNTNFAEKLFLDEQQHVFHREQFMHFKNSFIVKARGLAEEKGLPRFRVVCTFKKEFRWQRPFNIYIQHI